MKHSIILVIVTMGCLSFCAAQQPVLDPKNNNPGQKNIQPGQLKVLPPPIQKVSFNAAITEPRSGVPSYEDGSIIARFNDLRWNEGNGFDAATGTFTAPVQGTYCFIGNISLAKYGCVANHISYSVSVMKNRTQALETFNLPVAAGGTEMFTTECFVLLTQLNLNDKIVLLPAATGCTGGQPPMLRRVVFSGYKVN